MMMTSGSCLTQNSVVQAEKYLDYFSEHDPMKSYYQGRLLQEQGKVKEAYEKYENIMSIRQCLILYVQGKM